MSNNDHTHHAMTLESMALHLLATGHAWRAVSLYWAARELYRQAGDMPRYYRCSTRYESARCAAETNDVAGLWT